MPLTTTTLKPTTLPATAVTPTWVDTPENTEVERISAKFVGGQLSTDHSAVTNISVCYKSVSVRVSCLFFYFLLKIKLY